MSITYNTGTAVKTGATTYSNAPGKPHDKAVRHAPYMEGGDFSIFDLSDEEDSSSSSSVNSSSSSNSSSNSSSSP